jgi:DNA-binding CsgD family transcriptional regulator
VVSETYVRATAAVLAAGYVAGVLVSGRVTGLSVGDLGGVLGQLGAYPLAGWAFVGAVRRFRDFTGPSAAWLSAPEVWPRALDDPLLLEAGPNPLDALSPREREVLELICDGLVPKQIARRLGISAGQIYDHQAHMRKKTGVRTTAQLAGIAAEYGLFERDR